MKTHSFFVFLSILFCSHIAFGQVCIPGLYSECDFCMCSQGISPLEMGGSSLRIDTRYTELSQQYANGAQVANSTNARETYFTNQLSLTEGIASGLCATVIVPFAHKQESSSDPVNSLASISNTGIGDVSLLARYNIIADHNFGDTRIVSVTGGVKFANGSTSLSYQGASSAMLPADPDVQLGTGTTDFFAGAGVLFGFDNWSIGSNALTGIRGFGSGAAGHVYGDNVNYDVTARYRLYQPEVNQPGTLSPTVFGALGIRGEWRGYELQNGQRIDDSGGDVTYLAPGMQVFFTPRISFDATVWIPVIHALNGNQLGETIKVLAGLQFGL
jgi:hypothetical protein